MITLEKLSCTYRRGTSLEVTALKETTLSVNEGEYIIVVGSNGSGKSTLLNLLNGSARATTGRILIDKKDVTEIPEFRRSRLFARVFQNPLSGTAAGLSILENFRLAALRTGQRNLVIGNNKTFRKLVQHEVSRLQLGLENNPDRLMGSLSGGQRQALTLLMAVMSPCKILLLDEPAAALDPRTSEMVMRIADDLIRQHRLTAIHITHNMKDAAKYGSRLWLMEEGRISKDLNTDEKQNLTVAQLFDWFS